jgi:hypothetical protein
MRQGDYGGIIRVTVKEDGAVKDISTATTKQFRLIRPTDKVESIVTATFTSDGTDGKLQYTVASGLLSKKGAWRIQVLLTYASGYIQSAIGQFPVEGNEV